MIVNINRSDSNHDAFFMFNQINRRLHLRARFNPLINNQYFRRFGNEAFS